jgi:hypothetical protein
MTEIPFFIFFKIVAVVGLLAAPVIAIILPLLAFVDWAATMADNECFVDKPFTPIRLFFGLVLMLCSLMLLSASYSETPTSNRNPAADLFVWSKNTLFEPFDGYVKNNAPVIVPTRTNLGVSIKRFELVGWRPPKHFYVSLEDTVTHKVYNDVYVSKHCNNASNLKKGEEYNIQVQEYSMSNKPGVTRIEFNNLSSTFCN